MGIRHGHADIIHAWAEGAEIEILDNGQWIDAKTPNFCAMYEYRIKPKIVKREGWIAIYNHRRDDLPSCSGIYATEELCRAFNGSTSKVVRIEWEEEE